jgi:hypothetical protein
LPSDIPRANLYTRGRSGEVGRVLLAENADLQARRPKLAKKTVRVSDLSGEEIPDGKGAVVRITFADARKGARELDLTDTEAEKLGGRSVARRGLRPKAR